MQADMLLELLKLYILKCYIGLIDSVICYKKKKTYSGAKKM